VVRIPRPIVPDPSFGGVDPSLGGVDPSFRSRNLRFRGGHGAEIAT
jgi:hypothetical protein